MGAVEIFPAVVFQRLPTDERNNPILAIFGGDDNAIINMLVAMNNLKLGSLLSG
jgi:hypothetical protein